MDPIPIWLEFSFTCSVFVVWRLDSLQKSVMRRNDNLVFGYYSWNFLLNTTAEMGKVTFSSSSAHSTSRHPFLSLRTFINVTNGNRCCWINTFAAYSPWYSNQVSFMWKNFDEFLPKKKKCLFRVISKGINPKFFVQIEIDRKYIFSNVVSSVCVPHLYAI